MSFRKLLNNPWVIGVASGFIGWVLIQVAELVVAPRDELVAHVNYSDFDLPIELAENVESRFLECADDSTNETRIMESLLRQELDSVICDSLSKLMWKRIKDRMDWIRPDGWHYEAGAPIPGKRAFAVTDNIESEWEFSLVNDGSTAKTNVRIKAPYAKFAYCTQDNKTTKVSTLGAIEVARVQPFDTVEVRVWTSFPVSEWDLDDVVIAYDGGKAQIIGYRHISNAWSEVGSDLLPVLPLLISLSAIVFIYLGKYLQAKTQAEKPENSSVS